MSRTPTTQAVTELRVRGLRAGRAQEVCVLSEGKKWGKWEVRFRTHNVANAGGETNVRVAAALSERWQLPGGG